jgi:hypothetical protein
MYPCSFPGDWIPQRQDAPLFFRSKAKDIQDLSHVGPNYAELAGEGGAGRCFPAVQEGLPFSG